MALHAQRRASFQAVLVLALSSGGRHALAMSGAMSRSAPPSREPATIVGHPVRLDERRRLLPWLPGDAPYSQVIALAWRTLETKFTADGDGTATWLGWSRFDPQTFEGLSWPHNPAGLYAMLADSAVHWYAFSGDVASVDLVRKALDHQLAHGTTPGDSTGWDWALSPYASAGAGDVDYRGADDDWCDYCGRGDGIGVIEPDKVGELGYAYLQFYELTGEGRYRDAALACADALASHVRAGDARHSPWPFRVHARTNVAREEYSSNVVGALTLFDELVRLSLGDVDAYGRARALAFEWLMRFPMRNDHWSGYFEDVAVQPDPETNPNQYSALRTAQWLLAHPQADPGWRRHVAHLLAWAARVFGGDTPTESGRQWGATVMSEQGADMAKMASHTARFGAINALWFRATGDLAARDRAARSLNWATYACDDRGVVAVGESREEGWWFSDGYGDYIRHFLVAMAAVPEWAPAADHLLSSTSVVTRVEYTPNRVSWSSFDVDATETLRLKAAPEIVTHAGKRLAEQRDASLEGFTVSELAAGGALVRVRHHGPGEVVIRTKSLPVAADARFTSAPSPAARSLQIGSGRLPPDFKGRGGGGCLDSMISGSGAAVALLAVPIALAYWRRSGARGR